MLIKTLLKIYCDFLGAFHVELEEAIYPYTNVLDVGCGKNSMIHYFSDKLEATGVDGFALAIRESKERKIHTNYMQMDLNDIGSRIPEKSYDCVLCLDVIEHFDKEKSRSFVKELEKIARKKIVLFTPNGFVPQGAVDGNPFQIHRCGWSVEELEAMGYRVIGIYGHKLLRGEQASYKIKPLFLGRLFSDFTQPFVRNNPQKAFSLLATKEF